MMKLFVSVLILAAIVYVSAVPHTGFPDASCAGTPAAPLPDAETVALAPPFLYYTGAVGVSGATSAGERGATDSINSDVDSAFTRIVFRTSNKYQAVKFELISGTATPLSNEEQVNKPCNGYFNYGQTQAGVSPWAQFNQYCSNYYTCNNNFQTCSVYNSHCTLCSYTPYFVFAMETGLALEICFARSEGTEAINNGGTQTFYYFDTVVQSTYAVNRPTIRNKPVLRNVVSQTRLRYKFQKTISLTTACGNPPGACKAIYVGGLRQVYADIILLQFNPIQQYLYVQIFTSVQYPYQLFNSTRQNGADGSGKNVGVVPYPAGEQPGFTVVGNGLNLLPNTTSGVNCGVDFETTCEQVWEVYLTMPAYSQTSFYCNMNPALHVLYDVGCQDQYLDQGANCTVGTETAKADFSWINLPASDFCLKLVQSVTLGGSLTPYPSLTNANNGANNAVYSYVFGGPIYFRVAITTASTNGVVPTVERIQLRGVRVYSGQGMLSLYTFNISDPQNDFVWFNSGNLGQMFMVFTFRLNSETVTLATFDANQQVVVEADIRVAFQAVDAGFSKGGMSLQQEQSEISDNTVSSQFFVGSTAEDAAGVSAGSSMNVVAVAAGSAAGVVALTVIVAFIVHRRATKKIMDKAVAPATGKDDEEGEVVTNSMGSGSSV